ncbi:MAG: phosphatase [Ramlibacter sp.]|nr:phosphatase [Ramlibacter sp.]
MRPRTSFSHPLHIASVPCAPWASGVIGVTFCPGKWGDSLYGAPWRRDLDVDLDVIHSWGASLALSLIEDHEFALLRVPGLGEAFGERGIAWYQMPIVDLRPPDGAFHEAWTREGAVAVDTLKGGGKVLVHCRGGLGRAGTVGCMLLMELGATCAESLQRIRAARPGAVETAAQEQYLASYAPRFLGADG